MGLLTAAKHGRLEYVKFLIIEQGWDVNFVGNVSEKNGKEYIETPLLLAAESGHLEVVRYLVDQGAHLNGISNDEYKKNPNTATPLWWSVIEGHVDVARYLLVKGASSTMILKYGGNLLKGATWSNNYGMLDLILDQNFNIDDGLGETALAFAFKNCWTESVRCLLARGADFRKRLPWEGELPFRYGFRNSNRSFECMKILVDFIKAKEGKAAVADYLNNNDNSTGVTALHSAFDGKCPNIARLFLSCGASPNIVNNDGRKPHDSIGKYKKEELRVLVGILIENYPKSRA